MRSQIFLPRLANAFSPITHWLQAFSDYAFDRRKLGKLELAQQIKASEDAGTNGWLLWDMRNRYFTEILTELAPKLWRQSSGEFKQ
jgi:hypothetical protein